MRTLIIIRFFLLFVLGTMLLKVASTSPEVMEKLLPLLSKAGQGIEDHQNYIKTEELELKKQLEEVVPNLSKAVQAVHEHQPFSKAEAINVFYNRRSLALPQIKDLKVVESSSFNYPRPRQDEMSRHEKVLEETFRREKGLEYLRSLGTYSHEGWGGVLMTKSTFEFLEQLVQALAKDRKITPSNAADKEWFRTAFTHYLEKEYWASGKNLKTKVLNAIEENYPNDWSQFGLHKGKEEAIYRARVMVKSDGR